MRWESAGEGDYSVETIDAGRRAAPTSSCTCATDEDEFLSALEAARRSSRKYSDHISLPILMQKEEWDAEAKEQVVKDE